MGAVDPSVLSKSLEDIIADKRKSQGKGRGVRVSRVDDY